MHHPLETTEGGTSQDTHRKKMTKRGSGVQREGFVSTETKQGVSRELHKKKASTARKKEKGSASPFLPPSLALTLEFLS